MNKKNIWILIIIIILIGGYFVLPTKNNNYAKKETQKSILNDYINITYLIDGQKVKLENGIASVESAPGSASKTVTRYFGNELKTDLNNDGKEDIVFLLTQEKGGSGIFFYVVAAIKNDSGYVGSDGYFLGDRIAPQTTNISPNPKHKNVIVVNYADRNKNEPMTNAPSVGKSAYLKLNPETMQWGIVIPNFEGESNL
jgi:hypothetical protein